MSSQIRPESQDLVQRLKRPLAGHWGAFSIATQIIDKKPSFYESAARNAKGFQEKFQPHENIVRK